MERRRGVPGGWPCLLAALAALLAAGRAAAPRARFSPFFFLCTHHGELEGDGEQGEVLIALHIAGSPAAYVPGQEYHGRCRRLSFPALRVPCPRAGEWPPSPAAAQGKGGVGGCPGWGNHVPCPRSPAPAKGSPGRSYCTGPCLHLPQAWGPPPPRPSQSRFDLPRRGSCEAQPRAGVNSKSSLLNWSSVGSSTS